MKIRLAFVNVYDPCLGHIWRLVCQAENDIALRLADYPLGTATIGHGDVWYLWPDDEGSFVLVHAEFDGEVLTNPHHRFELEAIFESPEESDLTDYHRRLLEAKEAFCLVRLAPPVCVEQGA